LIELVTAGRPTPKAPIREPKRRGITVQELEELLTADNAPGHDAADIEKH
jgi:hypothetical protein